jgi:disulfide bond formation protein DsbB
VDVETFQLFFSLLSLVALGGAVLWIAVRVIGRRPGPAREIASAVDGAVLWIAFLVAATATAGSLYFSEVADFVPCQLCWYQRIAMYPLAPMLGIAAVRQDVGIRLYAWVLAGSGALISTYHYIIEWMPDLEVTACAADVPCTAVYVREFGFVSIAFMALCGFLAIAALLHVAARVQVIDNESSTKEVVQ